MRLPSALLLSLVTLLLCGGCAAKTSVPDDASLAPNLPAPQASDDQLLLLGGKIDVDNRFASTVIVTPDEPLGMCSGLLIAPRLVLTAGHYPCLPDLAPGAAPGCSERCSLESQLGYFAGFSRRSFQARPSAVSRRFTSFCT